MYFAKLKDGPKRVKKNFLNDFGKGFWNGMMDGEKMESHQKGFLMLKCFSPLKILTSPLFEETLGAFLCLPLVFFFFSFFNTFCLFFYALSLGGFDDIWEEKSLLQKILFK
jgi:hypothetical protein